MQVPADWYCFPPVLSALAAISRLMPPPKMVAECATSIVGSLAALDGLISARVGIWQILSMTRYVRITKLDISRLRRSRITDSAQPSWQSKAMVQLSSKDLLCHAECSAGYAGTQAAMGSDCDCGLHERADDVAHWGGRAAARKHLPAWQPLTHAGRLGPHKTMGAPSLSVCRGPAGLNTVAVVGVTQLTAARLQIRFRIFRLTLLYRMLNHTVTTYGI